MSTTIPDFPEADFYDCEDAEHLSHESPEEAVEYAIDRWATPKSDMVKIIAEHAPITVTCYRRMLLDEKDHERIARSCADQAAEAWAEDWGDEDGTDGYQIVDADIKRALPQFVAAVRALYSGKEPWCCEPIARVPLDEEQVEAMMREHAPEWFDP
jgi:hypothetical protein